MRPFSRAFLNEVTFARIHRSCLSGDARRMLRLEWMCADRAVHCGPISREDRGGIVEGNRVVGRSLDADLARGQRHHPRRVGDVHRARWDRRDGKRDGLRILAGFRDRPVGPDDAGASVIVLHFAFSDGRSARFDQAVLRGQDTLSGALTFDDQPFSSYGATFTRTLVTVSATQAAW